MRNSELNVIFAHQHLDETTIEAAVDMVQSLFPDNDIKYIMLNPEETNMDALDQALLHLLDEGSESDWRLEKDVIAIASPSSLASVRLCNAAFSKTFLLNERAEVMDVAVQIMDYLQGGSL